MNWKDKRVLITGGMGMIGMELWEQLLNLGADVDIADIIDGQDLTDFKVCRDLCLEKDYVFHLAGIKGSPRMTKERPVDFMSPMLAFDRNMIVAAQQTNVKRFFYTSSIAVENPETDKYPAWAKMTAELLIEAMRIQYGNEGTKYCIGRPANVYGKYDNFDNPNAMVVTSLVKKAEDSLVDSLKTRIPAEFEVWTDGSEIRDFINAKDVARAMILITEKMPEEPIAIGSGKEYTIKRLAEAVSYYSGADNIKYLNNQIGDKRRVMDITKLKELGFELEVELEDGIKEIIDWRKDVQRQNSD